MSKLYPSIASESGTPADTIDQSFRLIRISELDAYLRREVEDRRKLQKKYQRAVDITQGVRDGADAAGLGMEATGIALVTTGVGALPGIVLAGLGAGAFIVDLTCGLIIRKCTAKVKKHSAIEIVARTKLNSVHQMISKALIDNKITDEEFKLISDEVDRYEGLKVDIRAKARKSTDDEAAKKELTDSVQARLAKLENTLSAR